MYQCRCCYCGQIFESQNKRTVDCGQCDKTMDLNGCSKDFLIMMNRNQFEMIGKLKKALQYYAQPETYYIDFKNMAGLPAVCVDNGNIAKEALEI